MGTVLDLCRSDVFLERLRLLLVDVPLSLLWMERVCRGAANEELGDGRYEI